MLSRPARRIRYDESVQRRYLIPVTVGLFALSGASSLIFETAWTRLYLDLFGHGIHSTSSVLAAFMAGLGLGALAERRLPCTRPFRCYAALEFLISLWVFGSPSLVQGADHLAAGGMLRPGFLWLLSFAMLLVPTSMMGATLPLLARALIQREEQIGRIFGLLYGINSLGAVVGVLGAGIWGLLHLGLHGTLLVGCGLSLVASAGAIFLDRGARDIFQQEGEEGEGGESRIRLFLYLTAALAGMTAMAWEVLWIRAFVFVLESSILSLSLVLGVLLLALGLGSSLFPRLCRHRSSHLQALVWVQTILGVAGLGGLWILSHLNLVLPLLSSLLSGASPLDSFGGRFLLAASVVFVPGVLMGATMPAISGGIEGIRKIDASLGRLYASMTFGNIAGALIGGFVLIPRFGLSHSMLFLAGLNLLTGLLVLLLLPKSPLKKRVWSAALLLGLLAVLPFLAGGLDLHRLFADRKSHARLVAVSEGLRGTVTLFEVPPLPILASNADRASLFSVGAGYRMISVEGVDVAGSSPDLRTTQKMQAEVPLMLHGSAKEVLQIGYGSGETAHEVILHHPESFDLVEINPQVIEEAREFFGSWQSRGYHPIFADAKNYLRRSRRKYDAILNDSTYPGLEGSSQLYSVDHFRAGREHLRPGGVFSTWLPVDLPAETFAMILSSFRSVFPECSYWLPLNCWNKHGVLVGTVGKMKEMEERLSRVTFPPAVAASLAEIGLAGRKSFLSCRVLDAAGIRAISEGVAVNSDDHPYLEYPLRGFSVSGEGFWSETLRLIRKWQVVDAPCSSCVGNLLSGQIRLMAGEADRALELYERAGRECPTHPGPQKLREDVLLFQAQEAFERARDAEMKNERKAAKSALEEAVRLCPFSAAAKIELGRLCFEDRELKRAVELLEKGIRMAERGGKAWLILGDAHMLQSRFSEAEFDYRSYLDIEGGEENPEILAALAQAEAGQGRFEEAMSTVNRALSLRPGDRQIEELRGTLLSDLARRHRWTGAMNQ